MKRSTLYARLVPLLKADLKAVNREIDTINKTLNRMVGRPAELKRHRREELQTRKLELDAELLHVKQIITQSLDGEAYWRNLHEEK